jgi:hypothetical protein
MTPQEPRRVSGWLLATLCFAAAPLVFVIWFVLIALLWQVGSPVPLAPQFLISSLGLSAFAMWKLVRLGRRLRAPTADEILQKDQRPPVLYLRSFDLDTRTISKEGWTPFSSRTEYVPNWSFIITPEGSRK